MSSTDSARTLPANETVRLITGVKRLMHTPEIIEGETTSTGKRIRVERSTGSESTTTHLLKPEVLLSGNCEFRGGSYFELYTRERFRQRQRANRDPGPTVGADEVTDADELPAATHKPQRSE